MLVFRLTLDRYCAYHILGKERKKITYHMKYSVSDLYQCVN